MRAAKLFGNLVAAGAACAVGVVLGAKLYKKVQERQAERAAVPQAGEAPGATIEFDLSQQGPVAGVEISFPLDEQEPPAPVSAPQEAPAGMDEAEVDDVLQRAMSALEEDFSDLEEPQPCAPAEPAAEPSVMEKDPRELELHVNPNPVEFAPAQPPRTADGKLDVTRIASPEDFADWEQQGCKS